MIKINDFRKVLNERMEQAIQDMHCAQMAIGEIFLNTHKLKSDNGFELIDEYESAEEWDRVVGYKIDFECAFAVKEELSFLLYIAEHGLNFRDVTKQDENIKN